MECGLEFFPPSEAYWAASTLTIAERVAELREIWGSDMAPERTRTPWDWCTPDNPEPAPPVITPLPASASPIEHQFWDAHCRLALPELKGLVFQHPAGRFRLDFALPEHKFGIELDGFLSHSSTQDIERDHVRQRWLEEMGWHVTRYGGREVYRDAEWTVRDAARSAGRWAAP